MPGRSIALVAGAFWRRAARARNRVLLAGMLACSCASSVALTTLGWAEQVIIVLPEQIVFAAKIDTGAAHSSVHAPSVRLFTRGSQRWVAFEVVNRHGESRRMERPLLRVARIRRHFGQVEERPVVELTLCLGAVVRKLEVNLVDRTGLDYPLLIGRSFLAGDFLVDPSKTAMLAPICDAPPCAVGHCVEKNQ